MSALGGAGLKCGDPFARSKALILGVHNEPIGVTGDIAGDIFGDGFILDNAGDARTAGTFIGVVGHTTK